MRSWLVIVIKAGTDTAGTVECEAQAGDSDAAWCDIDASDDFEVLRGLLPWRWMLTTWPPTAPAMLLTKRRRTKVQRPMQKPFQPPPLQLHSGENVNGSMLQQTSSGDSGDVMIGEA